MRTVFILSGGVCLTVNIANHGGSIVCDGIYYFALSDYPNISDWELRNLILFLEYEKKNNRKTEIICENKNILQSVNHAIANPSLYLATPKPNLIFVPECTNCKKGGCLTDYLCHTTEIEYAKSIFKCGKLLSAVKARNKTGEDLAKEPRNGAKDTPDYFNYIMFTWGNCFGGDSLVTERLLNKDTNKNELIGPSEYDLSTGLKPGVRFYFKYDDIVNHKDYENDGHHPAKIKNELSLLDYLHCCIIPSANKTAFENIIPSNLANRIFFIENDCKDVWEWSDKIYEFVCRR